MNAGRNYGGVPQGINTEPLIHKSWSNLAERPPNGSTRENVLMYFCNHSNPFYDMSSDNQQLIMQNHSMSELKSLNGIQYDVVHNCGPLYIICKLRRNGMSTTPLCYYYILDGMVYQCPDVYTLIQSRLTQTVNPLREALLQASKFSRFDVNKGYSWQFEVEGAKSAETEAEEKEKKSKKSGFQDPTKVRGTQYQWKRADKILQMTLQKYPPSGMVFEPMKPLERMDIDQSAPGSMAMASLQPNTPMPGQSSIGMGGTGPNSVQNPASITGGMSGLNSKPATPASVPVGGAPQTPHSNSMDNSIPTPGTLHAPGSAPGANNVLLNSLNSGPLSVPSRSLGNKSGR